MMRKIFQWAAMTCLFVCLTATAWADNTLVAVGKTVGIRLKTDSVTVAGLEEGSGALEAGIQKGDTIKEINGVAIHSAEDLKQLVCRGTDGGVAVTVERDGKQSEYLVKPQVDEDGCRLGIYIRDGISGIGTVTYYDPDTGTYGALGHGVNDPETSKLIDMKEGSLFPATVTEVEKGKIGKAGQLKGDLKEDTVIGAVEKNTDCGIFGSAQPMEGKTYEVAEREEVEVGDATILSNVAGDAVSEYDISIKKIFPTEAGKNLLIEVTDEELLEKTGGIVQGMSGSPILQNGKLVGAVTHVLLGSPKEGYGIFADNMLDAAA